MRISPRRALRAPGRSRSAPAEGTSRGRVGVTVLILALVLIPLCGMAVLGGWTLHARRQDVKHATRIKQSISRVDALIALQEALRREQVAVDAHIRAPQLGMSVSDALGLLGLPPHTSIEETRAVTNAALVRLRHTVVSVQSAAMDSPAVDTGALARLRRAIDGGSVGARTVDTEYEALGAQVQASLHALLDALATMISNAEGGYRVWSALDALNAANDGLVAGSDEVNAMTSLLVGPRRDEAHTLVDLGSATALFNEAGERLHEAGLTQLSNAWDEVQDDPAVIIYENDVQSFENDPGASGLGRPLSGVGPSLVLPGGVKRTGRLLAVVAKSSDDVDSAAARLVAAASHEYHKWLLILAGLALVTIVGAFWVARFIARPIRRLAEIAHAVSAGRLDVACSTTSGPKETTVVAGAIAELVENLRLFERKSQALANCEFSDPILAEPLPGRLGRSIERSIRVLSGSIEERDKLQHRLAHQATHDALTGLLNRPAAVSALEQTLARAERSGASIGLLYIDLDGFKRANDNHGHHVGDLILKEIAGRMRDVVRRGDVLARLGGDEFLAITEGMRDVNEAVELARRLVQAIAAQIELENLRLTVQASVGIAFALDAHEEPGQLLVCADLAMYRAKAGGPGTIEVFDTSLQEELRTRADIEEALAAALAHDDDGLSIHYQPIIDCSAGRVVALEALIRWDRPGAGLLSPGEFIPVAEASQLIIDLDMWVMRHVAKQVASWRGDPDLAEVAVAINISGRHLLSQSLDEHLRDVLEETGIEPRKLLIEVTETVLLSDLTSAASELHQIRTRGVRVAIDDFGTGYTSISHLQHLPVDALKIDRSLVSEVDHARGRSIVRMITDLGHNLGAEVIAEGVETVSQQEALARLGCDSLQGFLIQRPAPACDIGTWLHARRRAA